MALNLGTILYALGVNTQGMVAGANAVRNFASANAAGGKASKQFAEQLRALESASILAVGPLSGLGARIRSLATLATFSSLQFAAVTAAIVGTGYGLFRLSQGAINANLQLTAMRQRLTLLTGSSAAAGAEFSFLTELADRAGTGIVETADSYSQFIASIQGTSLEGEKARDVFTKITMAGANLMLTGEQMNGTFRALIQMMSKGTVQAEELRGQLGDRLYGAFRIAAKAVGATTSQLNIMLKKGQVISSDFLPKFADAFVKAMGVDTTKKVENLQAATTRLSNSWLLFRDTLDRTLGLSGTWKTFIEGIDSSLRTMTAHMQSSIPIMGAVAGAMLGMVAPRIITAFGSLVIIVGRLALSWGILNAVMMANPILGVIGLLTRLAFVLGGAYLGVKLFQGALDDTDFEGPTQDVIDYLNQEDNMRRSLVATTDTFIDQTVRQIQAQQLRMAALQAQLDTTLDYVNEKFQKESPKTAGAIDAVMTWLFGDSKDASAVEAEIVKVGDGLQMLKTILEKLMALRMGQASQPLIDDGNVEETEANLARIRKAAGDLIDLQMQVQAMREGPGAVGLTDDFINVQNAIESYREQLIKTGISQDELNQKVGEFMKLQWDKINLAPGLKAVQELQSVFISFASTVSQGLADAFVDGTLSMQTFVDMGKRLLAQLIAKLIEVVILNQLINAAFGLTGTNALPTMGASGFAGLLGHAKGGVLNGPTYLGFSGGKHHVGGEKGPEAVMPLVRTSSGDLGVKAMGGGGSGGVQVALEINVMNEGNTKSDIKQNDSGGFDIRTYQDEQNAGLMMQPGSKSQKALRSMGANLPLKRL